MPPIEHGNIKTNIVKIKPTYVLSSWKCLLIGLSDMLTAVMDSAIDFKIKEPQGIMV